MARLGKSQTDGIRGLLRPLCLAFWLLAILARANDAQAQFRRPVAPSLLVDVSTADVGPGESRILLSFSPTAPNYSIINGDSDRPAIAFALTSRGSTARVTANLRGLVRSINFDQNDSILVVRLTAASRVNLSARQIGDKVISLSLTSAAPRAEQGPAPAPAGLPKASEREPGADGFELVPLKYADVSEVVGLLTDGVSIKSNDGFVPQEPAFGSAGMGGSNAFTPPAPPSQDASTESLGQSVDDAIGVDRRLNAIILKGSPDRIARLKEKIARIDVPVQSVLLETVFVELDESGARNVGLDFNNPNSQVAVATLQTGQFNIMGGGSERPLTSVALQGAIYAQVRAGHGRIVSKPRIAAQSGSTAKIVTGDALPILTAITLSGVNAVSQQVQYVNVGVTLQIAPRVSSDGFVTSHVFCVVSSVTGTSQGYPTISQREASTSATVRDGETFVIGGLTQESDLTSDTHFLGLSRIPLAGELFKLRTGTRAKTELYIVVTPHVVRRGDDTADLPVEAQSGPSLDR